MPPFILEFLVETVAPILVRIGLYFLEQKYPGMKDVVGAKVQEHKAAVVATQGMEIGNAQNASLPVKP